MGVGGEVGQGGTLAHADAALLIVHSDFEEVVLGVLAAAGAGWLAEMEGATIEFYLEGHRRAQGTMPC